ncbi:hypothetical protein [Paractinoplanes hotanensis]|uniref:GNAT family N-acetyltransferase n=1 Tax=Paractinoplanes hotanensis TaxID=2906497 RepID=A0ABT0YGG5_9ACTN|nr:hypothetical protein [Actinoplanes hotanensis]MCM4085136.1 hypothetical protein [Actinoplanes hotanensis]
MTDVKAFRRGCYEAARQTGGELTDFQVGNEPTPSFHQAIITYSDRNVAVVCVRDAPLMALAEPHVLEFLPARTAGSLTFVDLPELAAALTEVPGFRLLSVAELGEPVDAARCPQISQHDLRYWQPQTLGEALFNYWD